MNMARAELLGWGVQIAYQSITQDSLSAAINKVLDDPGFTEHVKKISKRFKDQPQSPMEKAIFWIEYVLRNDGAFYLQTSAQHLNFFEYYNLDIYSLFATIFLLAFIVPLVVVKKLLKCCMPKKEIKQKSN